MFLSEYKYLLIFLSLCVSGEVVLLPLVYSTHFGFIGRVDLVILAVLANIITDGMWYFIGKYVSLSRLHKLPFLRKNPQYIEKLSAMFESKGPIILFVSKFVYGTRIATQVLCGMHNMKYYVYFSISVVGSIMWTLILMGIVALVAESLEVLSSTVLKIQLTLTIIVAILVALHHIMKRYIKKKLLKE